MTNESSNPSAELGLAHWMQPSCANAFHLYHRYPGTYPAIHGWTCREKMGTSTVHSRCFKGSPGLWDHQWILHGTSWPSGHPVEPWVLIGPGLGTWAKINPWKNMENPWKSIYKWWWFGGTNLWTCHGMWDKSMVKWIKLSGHVMNMMKWYEVIVTGGSTFSFPLKKSLWVKKDRRARFIPLPSPLQHPRPQHGCPGRRWWRNRPA
jgi:hypothetical protein